MLPNSCLIACRRLLLAPSACSPWLPAVAGDEDDGDDGDGDGDEDDDEDEDEDEEDRAVKDEGDHTSAVPVIARVCRCLDSVDKGHLVSPAPRPGPVSAPASPSSASSSASPIASTVGRGRISFRGTRGAREADLCRQQRARRRGERAGGRERGDEMFYLQYALDPPVPEEEEEEEEAEAEAEAEAGQQKQLQQHQQPAPTSPDRAESRGQCSPTRYRGSPGPRRVRSSVVPKDRHALTATPAIPPEGTINLLSLKRILCRVLFESNFSPFSPWRRVWEVIGLILTVLNLVSYFSKGLRESRATTFGFLPVMDLYFVLDMVLRFKTGFVDSATGQVVMDSNLIVRRYLRGWFFFDLLLSIPYAALFQIWENTASLRLFSFIRHPSADNNPLRSRHKAIWAFIRHRHYRRQFFDQIRDAWQEKRYLQNLLNMKPRKLSLLRRTLRLIGGMFRLTRRLKMAGLVADSVSRIRHAAETLRTLTQLGRSRELANHHHHHHHHHHHNN